MNIVLDTCALIWWSLDPVQLSGVASQACKQMEKDKCGLVSSISLWEIAIKLKNNKLDLGVDLDTYLAALKKSDVIRIIPVDEDTWIESVRLNWAHRDPADRVVVALTRRYQASIVTSDKKIRDFCPNVAW
ncbi:MAG: type II toxin-antitoxin system VapC family toxin [Cyanobacteria bacterium J06631_9]